MLSRQSMVVITTGKLSDYFLLKQAAGENYVVEVTSWTLNTFSQCADCCEQLDLAFAYALECKSTIYRIQILYMLTQNHTSYLN